MNLEILQRLLEVYRAANSKKALFSSQGQAMSGIEELANYRQILSEAEDDWCI